MIEIFKRISVYFTAKAINNALNIKLSKWQKQYIFFNGTYHDEEKFGRRNGKTLANCLKVCLQDKRTVYIFNGVIGTEEETAFAVLKEDAETRQRRMFFTKEFLKVHAVLSEKTKIKLCKIEKTNFRRMNKT